MDKIQIIESELISLQYADEQMLDFLVTDLGNKEIINSLFKLNILASIITDKTLTKHPIVIPIIIGIKFFLSNDNCL